MSNQEKREALLEELAASIEGPRGPVQPSDLTEFAQALGASVVIPVSNPAEALTLYLSRQAALHEESRRERARVNLKSDVSENLLPRLKSSGGRPTVPNWTISRITRYSSDSWGRLQEVAQHVSSEEHKVSPAQIASFLIEKSLSEYDA